MTSGRTVRTWVNRVRFSPGVTSFGLTGMLHVRMWDTFSPFLITYWLWWVFQQGNWFLGVLRVTCFCPCWHWWEVPLVFTEAVHELMLRAFGTPALCFWVCKTQEIPESQIILLIKKSNLCVWLLKHWPSPWRLFLRAEVKGRLEISD